MAQEYVFAERFFAKFVKGAPNECWEWQGAVSKTGYAIFSMTRPKHFCAQSHRARPNHVCEKAHRIAYELAHGAPVEKNQYVCHSCDHPKCVNPAHLFLGDVYSNNRDALLKGRTAKGEGHGMHKLTEDEVRYIRMVATTQRRNGSALSRQFNVSRGAINKIVRRERWTHI